MTPAQYAAAAAELRRVVELSRRHQLAFEYSADGWRMVPAVDVKAPPAAEDDYRLRAVS